MSVLFMSKKKYIFLNYFLKNIINDKIFIDNLICDGISVANNLICDGRFSSQINYFFNLLFLMTDKRLANI